MQTKEILQSSFEAGFFVEDEKFVFPFMIISLLTSDESNIKALTYAKENNKPLFVAMAKEGAEGERVELDKIYEYGVVGNIIRTTSLEDGVQKVLFQGKQKAKILRRGEAGEVVVEAVESFVDDEAEFDGLIEFIKQELRSFAALNKNIPKEIVKSIEKSSDAERICDLILSILQLDKQLTYELFCEANLNIRLFEVAKLLKDLIESKKLQKHIEERVNAKMVKNNKNYFLKEQLKEIRKELGESVAVEDEIKEYKEKFQAKKPFMSQTGQKEVQKQLTRLGRSNQESMEANVISTWLDAVFEIPFESKTQNRYNFEKVREILDKEHYGIFKAKERIVEYFAVQEFLQKREKKEQKGAILCLVGAPGVGKTSLANSVATALGRKLARIALGGLDDTNELRGHRRTYVGSMPGRIVNALVEAKEMNPVVVLDEIDKLSKNMRGDPAAAMLEILDPEQNFKFRDYYLNFDIDLSQVIFIATANDASAIPHALRDRMEVIELDSYTPQEKFQIAKGYLIPSESAKHGFEKGELSFTKAAIELVIDSYTRESGVRWLRKQIAKICRKSAVERLKDSAAATVAEADAKTAAQNGASSEAELSKPNLKVKITPKNVEVMLEKRVFDSEAKVCESAVGVVNGLGWTSAGGLILKIEAIKLRGKGALQLTGQIGKVMEESCKISLSLAKLLFDQGVVKPSEVKAVAGEAAGGEAVAERETAGEAAVKPPFYNAFDLCLHIPEGAMQKDGPSAGTAMTTAFVSILSGRAVRGDVAMTGEITLSGRVLAIGGLKEKLIAAYNAGVKRALIPQKNYERDLGELPEEVKKGLEVIGVSRIEEVLKLALV